MTDFRYTMVVDSQRALDRHVKVANHNGKVDVTCPVCINLIVNGTVVIRDGENLGYSLTTWAKKGMGTL